MDRRKLLKYGAAGTVAAVTGLDGGIAIGEPDKKISSESLAIPKEVGIATIKRVEGFTSFIPGVAPRDGGAPPLRYEKVQADGMIIERNVSIRMRDGIKLYAYLYRPENEANGKVPPIVGWSPYPTFKSAIENQYARWHTKYSPGQVSKYAVNEFIDPLSWTRRGFAVLIANNRGHWYSEGDGYIEGGPQESQDEYDLVEWAGTQPWSNGKVGIAGVSYYTLSQYGVAALRPPHLAAINPWEGFSDPYRDKYFHGGIPENAMSGRWLAQSLYSVSRVEDISALAETRGFFDEYWVAKIADFSQIEVPAYVVASWSDHGLHSRGTLRAFRGMSSKQKWLEIHGRKKWDYFLQDDSVEKQMKFFDHFLKGIANDVPSWPKVRMEVRDRYYEAPFAAKKSSLSRVLIIKSSIWMQRPLRSVLLLSLQNRIRGTIRKTTTEECISTSYSPRPPRLRAT